MLLWWQLDGKRVDVPDSRSSECFFVDHQVVEIIVVFVDIVAIFEKGQNVSERRSFGDAVLQCYRPGGKRPIRYVRWIDDRNCVARRSNFACLPLGKG